MQKILIVAFLLLQSLFSSASAAPCASAPLATYTAGGFSCTIGSLDFSNFNVLSGPAPAQPFPAVSIAPVISAPNEFGLEFVVNQNAGPGQWFEQLIAYRVAGVGAVIDRNTLFFTGSSATDDAVVSAVEQKCVEGVFAGADGVSGCTGNGLDLSTVDTAGILLLALPTDIVPPAAFMSVVSDIAVDGGTLGTASLTSATNLFRTTAVAAQVPEPPSLALAVVAAVLMFLVPIRRRDRALLRR